MSDPTWHRGRGRLRRWLAAWLPDTDWSDEFFEELDRDLARRAATKPGLGLTFWYLRQLLSPSTIGFVRASRARQQARWHAMGHARLATGLLQDLRQACRGLARDPWMAVLVVMTLAVGIGSVAAMVGLGQRLFLSGPPHVVASERVQRVFLTFDDAGGRRTSAWLPFNTAVAIRDSVDGFDGAAMYRRAEELADFGGRVRQVSMNAVDGHYFAVLGAQAAAGRFIADDDATDVLVLSERVAVEEFGSETAALGQTVRLGEYIGNVIGVAPAGFAGPDLDRVDAWRPLDVGAATGRNWWLFGRLAPTSETTRATAEAQAIHEAVDPGQFFQWARKGRVGMAGVHDDPTGERAAETSIAALLLGVVALVLVISWVNVLNLLFARVARRQGEVLVRLALGIGRWRLARLMLTESLLLSLLGGLASLPVAYGEGALVRNVLLPGVAWESAAIDTNLMLVTFLAVLISGVLLGLLPARHAHRADLSGGLSEARQGPSGSRARLQTVLVTSQIMLSAAMLLCAGLFVKSFWTMRVTDLGVDASVVHVANLRSLDAALGGGGDDEEARYVQALNALRRTQGGGDGGREVALAVGLPFITNFSMSVHVDGVEEIPQLHGGGPFISAVSGGYFEVIGTEIVRGEGISESDVATGARVTVIGESTARTLWPASDPIGQCARIGGPEAACYRVVGIAEDVNRQGYREPPSLQFYLPIGSSRAFRGPSLLVRSTRSGGAYESALAAEISSAVAGIDFIEVRRLDTFLDPEIRPWKLGAVMLTMVSALAMVMSLAGVFGVLSYVVAQRRREIGVRMALGATSRSIRGIVLRKGLVSGLVGVFLGFAAVLAGSRALAPLLFETGVADPLVMTTTGIGLVMAAVLACLLPATQAARVDPVTSLRAEP